MSGFDLVPVDGGDPIHLPPGESVLGRGPFLRVSDKRVSRLHGLLENMDGQLRLKPTHLNPCFVQSSLTDEPRPLQRDVWHPLRHGALFSLLPGRYTFQVVAVGGEDTTPRNSQMFEEEVEELHVSPAPELEPPPSVGQDKGQTPPREESTPVTAVTAVTAAAPSKQEEVDHLHTSLDKKKSSSSEKMEDNQNNVAPSVTKRRVLPAWMMAAVGAPHSSSSLPKASPAAKARKKAAAASTSKEPASANRRGKTLAEEAELSEEEKPKKRRRKILEEEEDEDEEPLQSKAVVSVQVQLKSNSPAVNDDQTESATMKVDEDIRGRGETSTAANTRTPTNDMSQPENEDKKAKNGRPTAAHAESVRSDSSSVSRPAPSRPAPSRPPPRTPCPYGKDCYRKNPLHFQECSHPGDSDYEDEEEEDTSQEERPECPYGTDCYRKNPLHRKEYKHTQKPAYATRRRPEKTAGDDEDEDEDSGDDDSFINDDSEDAGDDSDYAPPESYDSGKEDVKRLQREATAFLRQKK